MESGGQRRQVILASTLAVVAALALAASVTYAFGPARVVVTTTVTNPSVVSTTTVVDTTTETNATVVTVVNNAAGSIDCTKADGHVLHLGSQPMQLKANGTVSIGNETYWYATFIPMWSGAGSTTILFQGVNFTVSSPSFGSTGAPTGTTWIMNNITLLTTWTGGGGYCGYFLPPISVRFPDGSSVAYNTETVVVGANSGAITFDKPSTNPWFTQHSSPQAGIGYQVKGGQITLYVSTT